MAGALEIIYKTRRNVLEFNILIELRGKFHFFESLFTYQTKEEKLCLI
jgi:hypothetical protein